MAGTPAKATASKAEDQEPSVGNVPDERDTSPRAKADLSGKRVRAIPSVITRSTGNATTIEVTRADFNTHDIDHPTVTWDFRKDNYTLKVGTKAGQISEEAADFLTEKFPTSFEYLDES